MSRHVPLEEAKDAVRRYGVENYKDVGRRLLDNSLKYRWMDVDEYLDNLRGLREAESVRELESLFDEITEDYIGGFFPRSPEGGPAEEPPYGPGGPGTGPGEGPEEPPYGPGEGPEEPPYGPGEGPGDGPGDGPEEPPYEPPEGPEGEGPGGPGDGPGDGPGTGPDDGPTDGPETDGPEEPPGDGPGDGPVDDGPTDGPGEGEEDLDYDITFMDGLDDFRDDDGVYHEKILPRKGGYTDFLLRQVYPVDSGSIAYAIDITGEGYREDIDRVDLEVFSPSSGRTDISRSYEIGEDIDWLEDIDEDVDEITEGYMVDLTDGMRIENTDPLLFDQPGEYKVRARAVHEDEDGEEVVVADTEYHDYLFDPLTSSDMKDDWDSAWETYHDHQPMKMNEAYAATMDRVGSGVTSGLSWAWNGLKSTASYLAGRR